MAHSSKQDSVDISQNFSAPRQVRLPWIDATKGLAIILVVLSHSGFGIPYLSFYMVACYMPVFFVCSGYTFKDKEGVYIKKVKRLLKPYIHWILFYLAIFIIQNYSSYDQILLKIAGCIYSRFSVFSLGTENNVFLFPSGAAPLWFLTCMALSYLLLKPLLRIKGWRSVILVFLYFSISCALIYCPILLPWSADTAFLGAIFIFCGIHLNKMNHVQKITSLIILVAVCLGYIILARYNGSINMSVREYGSRGIISVFFFFIIGIVGSFLYLKFFYLLRNNCICRFFAYFGRASLTIMCAHMLFLLWFDLMISMFHIPAFSAVFKLVFALLGCLVLDYALNRWALHKKQSSRCGASAA